MSAAGETEVQTPQSQQDTNDVSADIRAAINEARGDSEAPVKLVMDRPRNDAGQFTRQEGQDGKEAAAPKPEKRPTLSLPEKTKPADAQGTATPGASAMSDQVVQAVKPPDSWTNPMKAKFAAMDRETQEYIAQRDRETRAAISRTDEFTDLGRRAREAAAPYDAIIRAEGGDTLGMLKDYLNYAYVFRTASPQQKVAALHQLATQFNIPLGVPAQQGPSPYSALEQQLRQQQQSLEQMRLERQQEIQQRSQDEQAGYESVFEDFAGEAGHEHFETLRPAMGQLMMQGHAKTLEEAYEQAAWANPEIRATLLQARDMAAQTTRNQGLNAKATAARQAAVSVTGAPGNAKPVVTNASVGSVEDDLRAAFRQHSGRV